MNLLWLVSEFDQHKEEWTSYAERMTHYFAANKVDDGAQKRSILLSAVGSATYKLLRSLVDSGDLTSKSYEELVEVLKSHFDPKPSIIVQSLTAEQELRARVYCSSVCGSVEGSSRTLQLWS